MIFPRIFEISHIEELKWWTDNLWQDKLYPTRKLWNNAYDEGVLLRRPSMEPVIILPEDIELLEEEDFEGDYSDIIKKVKLIHEYDEEREVHFI